MVFIELEGYFTASLSLIHILAYQILFVWCVFSLLCNLITYMWLYDCGGEENRYKF